ncbi:MAG: hypothetical protein ACOH2D_01605 [Gelidibacter sp.]|uniref:hypothetical protein n=1 Tax=Gelidibacter sp. TaxID=2018083 RepID=UPI0032637143
MKTEALKINVVQRILSISDKGLLQKIENLLNKENVFAFDVEGNPITENDYVKNLDAVIDEIVAEKADLYTTTDVLKRIADDNKLAL